MKRTALRIVSAYLLAGGLPLASAIGLVWLLATHTGMTSGAIALAAAGLGAIVLAVVASATIPLMTAAELVQPDPVPVARDAAADDSRPPASLDLGPLAEALAAETKGPPGPTLRRLLYLAHPPSHNPRWVGVNDAAEVCIRVMQETGPSLGPSLAFDPDPNAGEARIDPDSFHLLLVSLIHNARSAAGPSGTVEVRTQAMGDHTLVAVRDDGPGVPEGEMDTMFDPLGAHCRGSAGIGLALCRRVAEAHGAVISVTNVLPHGLEVGVRFPTRGQ